MRPPSMTQPPRSIVAMAHVRDVPRSIAFYEQLGLVVTGSHTPEGFTDPVWAHLSSGNAHLMLAVASDPVGPHEQAVLFYLYFDDILATHAALREKGFAVGDVSYPFYCPKGEFRLTDPEGYCLMLTHT